MIPRFIVDAQLPPALAKFLINAGYPSEHVLDFAIIDNSIKHDSGLSSSRKRGPSTSPGINGFSSAVLDSRFRGNDEKIAIALD